MNPQDIVMKLLQKNMNPFMANLVSLAQKGNEKELRKIAKNTFGDSFENNLNDLKNNPFKFLKF